ncbi:MAG TPA: hypothetical protein VH682_17775 [Gemmataceae bacterium]|jgi:hypothetical protein
MGHHISVVLLRGPFDEQRARSFDLKPIRLTPDIVLFPLEAGFCDHWAGRLGISGFVSDRPLLNCRVVHHLMREVAPELFFAVIETDYFGGQGGQAAAVYRGDREVMAPAVGAVGPINEALRHLSIRASAGNDEFDTVGLGRFRDFDDLFDSYRE